MQNQKQLYVLSGLIAVLVFIAGINSVQATPISNGSIFLDEFSGTALDTAKWEKVVWSGDPTVGSGEIKIDSYSIGNGVCAIQTKTDVLHFSGTPDNWVAEIRFVHRDISYDTKVPGNRQIMLMMAQSGGQAIAFDLRLTYEWGSSANLRWHGYDNTGERAGEIIAGVSFAEGTYYTVTVDVDNVAGDVDIYLDGNFMATKDLIVGVGDYAGVVVPDSVLMGAPTTPDVDMSVDYITFGAPPKGTIITIN